MSVSVKTCKTINKHIAAEGAKGSATETAEEIRLVVGSC